MSAVALTDSEIEYLAGAALRDGKQQLAKHLLVNRMTERVRSAQRGPLPSAPTTRSGLPKPPTNTVGGARDQTAIVGHAPEHREWEREDITYPPQVDKSARLEAYVTVDAGKESPTVIEEGAWLMKHVHVGHDAWIGVGAELSPGVVICGHAVIGEHARIGVNACVLPYVKVGNGARIGAGAVVTKDVPSGQVWAGNPAKRLPPKFRVV